MRGTRKTAARRCRALTAALIAIAACLLASTSLRAQDRSDDTAKAAVSDPARAGRATFQQNCGFCHGQDGRGASGPDLIRSSLVSHDTNGDLIGEVVHNGRPAKGMPSFPLPDADIRNIAAFLHTQARLASTVASRIPTDYPIDKLLIGNADAGKQYFHGTGGCTQCHSVTGDFAHIATKYKPLELQSHIAFPDWANPQVTLTDAGGHTYKGQQIYGDEFFITLLLTDGTRRTWDLRNVKTDIHNPLAAHIDLLRKYTDKDIHDLLAYLETLK